MKDKEEFLRRKKGVRNQADVVAQQLINIYRQLSILGEGATERYNKQLLEQVNPDVLSSFKTIPKAWAGLSASIMYKEALSL